MSTLHLDFETYSECDLKRCGADVYSKHPSTKVLCMAWAIDDDPVSTWIMGETFPSKVFVAGHAGYDVVAHNFAFEYLIWNNVLLRQLNRAPAPLSYTQGHRDTMLRAWSFGLPGDLIGAGMALNAPLVLRKDMAGHALMLKLCKPGRDGKPHDWGELTARGTLATLANYCKQDVIAERWLDQQIPPLVASEVKHRMVDFEMNSRGLPMDPERVDLLESWSEKLTPLMHNTMNFLTKGQAKKTTEVKKIMVWLQARGVDVDTLAKVRLEDALIDNELDGDPQAKSVVELRLLAAKSSVAKLRSMKSCMGEDRRVRGVFQFLGAGRTGRYAGRLIQPQNFPRGTLKRDAVEIEIERVEVGLSEPGMLLASSALRSCIKAEPGNSLVSVDFNAIEARVLAWLSGNKRVVALFRAGDDPYVAEAKAQGSTDRKFGKVMVLGLGYGMGGAKFKETAKLQAGIKITEDQAKAAVDLWRMTNWPVTDLWKIMDATCRRALTTPGTAIHAHETECMFLYNPMNKTMRLRLPSGRHLWYQNMRVESITGELIHDGVNSFTKKWGIIRTYGGKLVENVVQAIARDILMEFMRTLHLNGAKLVGSVHDEVIIETGNHKAQAALEWCILRARRLEQDVPWLKGLPLDASGWTGERYGK